MATASTYEKGKLCQLPITDLKPDPDHPRRMPRGSNSFPPDPHRHCPQKAVKKISTIDMTFHCKECD